ncbi:MAG TPA: ABC transporter ATP-binding protein [Firmicutes bacterium]|nr:ABC transporter ATP-binding protein [Bacillota bacterium]
MAGLIGPKEKAKDAKAVLIRLWGYLQRQKWALLLAFLLVIGSSLVSLVGPFLIGEAVDYITPGPGAVNFAGLRFIAGVMLIVYIFSATSAWFQNWILVGISQTTVHDLRKDLFYKVQKLPVKFFDMRTHGEIMSRLANDVENVSNTLANSTTQFFSSVITVSGALIAMLLLNPFMTVVSLVSVPFSFFITMQIAKRTRKYFMAQQTELGNLNGYIEEMIVGQKVVKAFSRENETVNQFNDINLRLQTASAKAQIFSGIIPPLMNVINNLTFALVAGVGGWLAIRGDISIGVVASFIGYTRHFARPINDIANQVNMLQSALAGAERVFGILDEEEEVEAEAGKAGAADRKAGAEAGKEAAGKAAGKEAAAPIMVSSNNGAPEDKKGQNNTPLPFKGEVVFRNVSFGYKGDVPVLKNINFTARPGQTIALVGPTGAGKTTIVNLLMRFYDVNEGSITIDGIDIRDLPRERLRSSLGIVLQDTYLFTASVKENIRYGRLDATDEEVVAAAKLANADIFISRLPQGYDTMLSLDGGNLSQGQRQLLAIARAVLADPAILILDEATSSVDTRTEMHIQAAMLKLMKGRTSFVIAHRLSTIQGADEIMFIDHGEIVERGTHAELMEQKGYYYKLYSSQFRRHSQLAAAGRQVG